jgi:hypothetical protein
VLKDRKPMDDTAAILWGLVFGSIGMGYIIYGRKQRSGIALLSGVVLFILPYFVSNVILMILIAIILMALPYFLKN